MPHSSFCWGSDIFVETHYMYTYWIFFEVEKKQIFYVPRRIFTGFKRSHDIYFYSVTPLCHHCVQTYQKIFVYESSNFDHLSETILDIRGQVVYIYANASILFYLYILGPEDKNKNGGNVVVFLDLTP